MRKSRPTARTDPLPANMRERLRDTRLILVMRGLRSLAYGLLAVLLGVALAGEGFTPVAIGALITVSLIGDMVGTYVIGLVADTWGRRRILALLSLLMAATGVIFGLVTSYPVLLAAGLPALLVSAGLPLASGIRLLFGMYAVLGLVVAGLSLRLPSPVEAPLH